MGIAVVGDEVAIVARTVLKNFSFKKFEMIKISFYIIIKFVIVPGWKEKNQMPNSHLPRPETAEQALEMLKQGNARFVENVQNPNQILH